MEVAGLELKEKKNLNLSVQYFGFIVVKEDGKIIVKKGTKINQRILKEIEQKIIKVFSLAEESLIGNFIACDIIEESTGKIFYEAGYEIDEDFISLINDRKLSNSQA